VAAWFDLEVAADHEQIAQSGKPHNPVIIANAIHRTNTKWQANPTV